MTFNPQKYMCVDELAILDYSRIKYVNSKHHPIILYNSNTDKRTSITYKITDKDIFLDKKDMGEAFNVDNGEGFQEYRKCVKELVYSLSEYISLITFILTSIEINDYRLDVNNMQRDWNNDEI